MNRWLVSSALWAVAACTATSEPAPGSQTHFLETCAEGDCAAGLSCVCGVCTLACDADAPCQAQAESAVCSARADSCGGPARVCDVECMTDRECSALGARFGCEQGRCRTRGAPPGDAGPIADAATDAGQAPDSGTLAPDADVCDARYVTPNEGEIRGLYHLNDQGDAYNVLLDPLTGAFVYSASGCDYFAVIQGRFVERAGRWFLLPAAGETMFLWPNPEQSTYVERVTEAEVIAEADAIRVSFAQAPVPQRWTAGGVCAGCPPDTTLLSCPEPYFANVCPTVDPVGDRCEQPAEVGPCDAAIMRYYYDPSAAGCLEFTYGGCAGNANNFTTLAECEAGCVRLPLPHATACEVDGTVYPSGAKGIDDPQSCNTCVCERGQLACTEIACAEPCPAGTEYAVSCSQCGPADGCEILRSGCLPTCETNEDCTGDAPRFCFDGICRIVCG